MICRAGTDGQFAQSVMVTMGLVSMAVAALFVIRERDFKRMLAYSSVEHMGILVLGIGLGGAAVYGALLHLLNNGLTKVVLFLSAGNIHRAYGSKVAGPVQGALRRVPISGALFLVGFLAICGSPPFGPFISEWTIFQASLGAGQFLIGGLYLLFLAITFVGMGTTVLPVVQGDPPEASAAGAYRENAATVAPIILAVALVLLLGVWIPQPLAELLRSAAAYVDVPR
jgi:hydrogenase-4 component F